MSAPHETTHPPLPEAPLRALGLEINAVNSANGWKVCTPADWHDPHKIPAMLALIHSEISEALEGFRHNDRENFQEEMADSLIRLLDCATGLGLNLDTAVREKIEKNKQRGLHHGGKRL